MQNPPSHNNCQKAIHNSNVSHCAHQPLQSTIVVTLTTCGCSLSTVGLMDLALTQRKGGIELAFEGRKGSRVPARGGLTSIFGREREQTVELCSDASVSREHTVFTKQHRGDFHCKLTRERNGTHFSRWPSEKTAEGSTPRLSPENCFTQIWARCKCHRFRDFWSPFTSERRELRLHTAT